MKAVFPAALVLVLALACSSAFASGGGGGEHGGGEKKESKGTPGNNVEMPILMAPVSDAKGKLVAYAYISAKIEATSANAALKIREKLAFIQDGFVREVNRLSVAGPADPEHVDEHKLQTRLLASAQKVMGGKAIKNLTITKVQVASLYPKAKLDPLPPEAMLPAEAEKKPEKKAESGHH